MAVTVIRSDTGQLAIVPVWLIDYPELVARDLLVYLALVAYADAHTGEAWPSRASLAARCRVASVRTIDAALAALERAGALTVTRRSDARGSRSSLYTLHRARADPVQRAAPPRAAGCPPRGAARCAQNHTQANQGSTPRPPHRARRADVARDDARFAHLPSYTHHGDAR